MSECMCDLQAAQHPTFADFGAATHSHGNFHYQWHILNDIGLIMLVISIVPVISFCVACLFNLHVAEALHGKLSDHIANVQKTVCFVHAAQSHAYFLLLLPTLILLCTCRLLIVQ